MEFDFSRFGLDETEPEHSEPETAEESAQKQPQPVQYMEEVDRRLDVAATYRSLLRNPLFEGDATDSTTIVESEIREFIVNRLQVLLSMKDAPAKQVQAPVKEFPFSDFEVQTLKLLLDSMVKKGLAPKPTAVVAPLATAPAPKTAPTVRRATAPVAAPAKVPPVQPAAPKAKPKQASTPPGIRTPDSVAPTVIDPRTGEEVQLRRTKRQVVPVNRIPMPTYDMAVQDAAATADMSKKMIPGTSPIIQAEIVTSES